MVLHRKQTMLQDYFPAALTQLIQQATTIKLKIIKRGGSSWILTAWGQILTSKGGSFKLWRSKPVQDIICSIITSDILDYGKVLIYAITLNANVIRLNDKGDEDRSYHIDNAISVVKPADYILAVTNTGELWTEYSELKLPGPVVAVTQKEDDDEITYFLQLNGELWLRNTVTWLRPDIRKVVDVSEVVGMITPDVLVRIDGTIYQRLYTDGQNPNYELETDVKDVVMAGSRVLITRNDDYYVDKDKENIGSASRTSLLAASASEMPRIEGNDVKAIAVSDYSRTVIRNDGVVLRQNPYYDYPVLETVPRLNVYQWYT